MKKFLDKGFRGTSLRQIVKKASVNTVICSLLSEQ